MKIFVTGATGFVGSHFARLALASGHQIVATRRTKGVAPAGLAGLDWRVRELDACEPQDFAGCDAVVHFAAAGVSPQKATRAEMTRWNVAAPLTLMETAADAGIRRFVHAGTFAEYGRAADQYDPIPPDAPLLPTSHYAASKAACFASAYALAVEAGLELCWLRIFSAFGEGQFEANFWPSLRRAALAGEDFAMTPGEQVRDYVAVEDVAAAFLHAVTRSDVEPGRPLVRNVGSGRPVTMAAFARDWWQRFGATGTLQVGALAYRPNEVMRFVPLITN